MNKAYWSGVAVVALVLALGAPVRGAVVIGPIGAGVEGVVTDLGGGVFQYDYTVYSGGAATFVEGAVEPALDFVVIGGLVDSFLIPFFDTADVAIIPESIQAPLGWTATFRNTIASFWSYNPFEDPDQFNYEVPASEFVDPPYVLEFAVDVGDVTPGAEWVIGLVPITGFSFQSHYSDTNGPVVIEFSNGLASQDPPHVKSPSHPANAVPEPAGLGLIGLAILAMRKRK